MIAMQPKTSFVVVSLFCAFGTVWGGAFEIDIDRELPDELPVITDRIEPVVRRHPNVFPREVCRKIIELGEMHGFPMEHDSIDAAEYEDNANNKSQAIDVMAEDGTVNYPDIFREMKPFIDDIADLIVEQRNAELDAILFPKEETSRRPELGWIFFRKYSPETPRNSLVPHYDSNMHTVNIALNHDFTGGGVFYVKPDKALNPDHIASEENNYFWDHEFGGVPELHPHQYAYSWTNSLKRENTSDIVFPYLEMGDALIHNYTVWHAVAPIETGTRYSMVLFFDMHNPLLPDEPEVYNDDNPNRHVISIRHDIKHCDIETGELVLMNERIEVYWVNMDGIPEEPMIGRIRPGKAIGEVGTYAGHSFVALRPSRNDSIPLSSRAILARIDVLDEDEYFELYNDEDYVDMKTDKDFLYYFRSENEHCGGNDDDMVTIHIKHNIKACDPDTRKLVFVDENVDVYWMDDEAESMVEFLVTLTPGSSWFEMESFPGHKLLATRPNDDEFPGEILASIIVRSEDEVDGSYRYEFQSMYLTQDDCRILSNDEL